MCIRDRCNGEQQRTRRRQAVKPDLFLEACLVNKLNDKQGSRAGAATGEDEDVIKSLNLSLIHI